MAHKFSEGSKLQQITVQAPGQQAGVNGKIAALPRSNGEDFQPISKIHGLLCGQEKKQEYVLMKNCPVPSLQKLRVSLVTGILNRRRSESESKSESEVHRLVKEASIANTVMVPKAAVSPRTGRVSVYFG